MILRAIKDGRWTAINNTVLNDERLSWRAKGIAAYLLTKPDDWRIDHTHLWHVGKEGRDAVLAAMKELEENGYLVRTRFQKPNGKFATEVRLYESPQIKTESQDMDFQEPTTEFQESVDHEDFQEPTTGNQKSENQKSVFQDSLQLLRPIPETEEEDYPPPLVSDRAREAVHAAWRDQYGEPMPANLIASIDGLTVECGPAAVIHGIAASVTSQSRNFKYIAKCARNYVPAPTNGHAAGGGYVVTLPPADIPRDPQAGLVAPPPLSRAQDDPWAICLAELLPTLQGPAQAWLTGSVLFDAGDVKDADGRAVPLYRVVVEERAALGVQWLTKQAGVAIRRTLGSVLGRPVLVEIVAADATSEVAA